MRNPLQEFEREITNELAIIDGKPPHWTDVQIEETEQARLTDPLQGDYWRRAGTHSPRWADRFTGTRWPAGTGLREGKSLIERLERIASSQPASSRRARNYGRDHAASQVVKFLPDPHEPVSAAIARLETVLANKQRDPSAWPYWATLRTYASKLPSNAKVRDLDPSVVTLALKHLVAGKI